MANTPKTVRTVPLNGTVKDFTIPFEYLARKFVVVTLIGSTRRELVLNTEYRFTSDNSISTMKAWGSNDGFDLLEVRRLTSATERLVDFSDGSILRAYDLNISSIQSLHIAEEARDLTADTISINNDGNLDARARKIVNLASGVDDGDAVSMRQLRQFDQSALNSAIASANSAQESLASANSASSSAAVSVSKAGEAMVSATSARDSSISAGQFSVSASNAAAQAMQSANAAAVSEAIAKAAAAPYLGPQAVQPTTRRDGLALQVGDSYLNTTDGFEYILKSSGWVLRNLDGAMLALPSGASRIGSNIPMVKTMADLLAYQKTSVAKQVYLGGYYAYGDVDIGVYKLDETDTTSVSNGGSLVVANDGGRWKLLKSGVINVKVFGAKGDGVQDDSPFIQKAVNVGSVFFPKGDYKISSTVQLPAIDLTLYGEGRGSRLFGSPVTLISWPKAVNGPSRQVTQNAQGLFFEQQGTTGSCVDVGQTWDAGGKLGPEIHGCHFSLANLNADNAKCMLISGLWSGEIYNNQFLGVNRKGYGIYFNLGSNMNTSVMNLLIQGNIMVTLGYPIYTPNRSGDGRVEGIKIIGNNLIAGITGIRTSQCLASSIVGNQISDFSDIGIQSVADFDLTIIGNGEITAVNTCISLTPAAFGFCERITISGNNLGITSGVGIRITNIVNNDYLRGILLSGNTIKAVTSVAYGISIEGNMSVSCISMVGNLFTDCAKGIYVSPVPASSAIVASGNVFWNCAIKVDDSIDLIVKGKRVWSTSIVRTVTGGAATEVLNLTPPVGYFSSKPLSAFLSGNIQFVTGYYDFDASTLTNLVFTLRAADGSNLSGGARRFGILVGGNDF